MSNYDAADALPIAPEALPIPAINLDAPNDKALPFTKIGLGRPLSLKILSIFPGSASWHRKDSLGAALITSAVKNPSLDGAAALALNYYFKEAMPGRALKPTASGGGSDVIYYSPGMIHDSLEIEIRQSFDKWDPSKLGVWTDAIGKAANLPVFAVSPHTASAGAIVYAAANAIKFAARFFDGWFDNEKDWVSSWTLRLSTGGLVPATESFALFYGNDDQEKVQGSGGAIFTKEFADRDEQYVVNQERGTLCYRDNGEQVLEGSPYVLAILDGAADSHLTKWTGAAVTAVLYERFFGTNDEGRSQDVGGILEAYNDIVMAREIAALDADLGQLPEAERRDSSLQKKRDGAVKNIQDKTIRDMFK
ncbi:hypothetical protein [Paenarthrobacter sp. NPDC058040]|uniref:hypothetical protein n=1 Tax=unclassified Paenarthrobacter TaxID=2634190 RepID=UPI0036DF860B